MHAKAVKVGVIQCELNCAECHTSYGLFYDSDAEVFLTRRSVLAEEIITARHPYHLDRIALEGLKTF